MYEVFMINKEIYVSDKLRLLSTKSAITFSLLITRSHNMRISSLLPATALSVCILLSSSSAWPSRSSTDGRKARLRNLLFPWGDRPESDVVVESSTKDINEAILKAVNETEAQGKDGTSFIVVGEDEKEGNGDRNPLGAVLRTFAAKFVMHPQF